MGCYSKSSLGRRAKFRGDPSNRWWYTVI